MGKTWALIGPPSSHSWGGPWGIPMELKGSEQPSLKTSDQAQPSHFTDAETRIQRRQVSHSANLGFHISRPVIEGRNLPWVHTHFFWEEICGIFTSLDVSRVVYPETILQAHLKHVE